MSYSDKDKSVDDGQPIECYEFVTSFGDFLFTNSNQEEVVDGKTFEPLNVSRSDISTSSALDSITTVDVTFPVTHPLAVLYCLLKSPSDLALTIYRVHRGDDFSTDFSIRWQGAGAGSFVDGNYATIKTGSIVQTKLNGSLGNVLYQRSCNHTLYDTRCKVDPSDYTIHAAVTFNQVSEITLDDDLSGNSVLKGGTITVDRTGEYRGIIDNVDNVITVFYPFVDLQVGDTVTLLHGCNHSRLGDCKQKFNNVLNYGGMDFIPTVNPFTDLKDQNIANIVTNVSRKTLSNDIVYAAKGWN